MNPVSGTASEHDAKAAAIEQWTADPCGSSLMEGAAGSRSYVEGLIKMRADYAPWMIEELGYSSCAGLDVLDVGCGQGIDVAQYAIGGARATGVDLTPRHVELATAHLQALGSDARVVQGDAEALPFADASFDRVSSNGVLHHTPDMPAALREIVRVLRPGGEARVIVYNRNSLHYWVNQFAVKGVLRGGIIRERGMSGVLSSGVEYSRIGARPLVRVYSKRQVRAMLEAAGLEGVTAHARHFRVTDTVITRLLGSRVAKLRDPEVLDRIGRVAGWYVIGAGVRPRTQGTPPRAGN